MGSLLKPHPKRLLTLGLRTKYRDSRVSAVREAYGQVAPPAWESQIGMCHPPSKHTQLLLLVTGSG